MKGLFNKVRNRLTRRRYVVSTIRKSSDLYETAVFATNFFYLPRNWSRPDFLIQTPEKDEAWDHHFRLTARLAVEYPGRLFEEYLAEFCGPDRAPSTSPPADKS
ncbi:MAG: hypothetical protein FJ128_02070 [Deltaproteobacteria bacterium]|nr:hypothetical protein [Deltaproteobacteria bacterium]